MAETPRRYRWLILLLLALVVVLQYRLWVSDRGYREAMMLADQVEEQRAENKRLRERNQRLEAEVNDLKSGFEALEERARSDLGMVAPGEDFYLVGEPEGEGEKAPSGQQ